MKNKIKRYFPTFFDTNEGDQITAQFETLKELLEIPFIKEWSAQPEFCGFALSCINNDRILLMAQLNEGYEWWVIGILEHLVEGLPKWHPKYKEEQDQPPRWKQLVRNKLEKELIPPIL